MQIKYKALFELEILHSYYQSGKCPDMGITPTDDCRSQLNSLGLLFLPTTYGAKLFAKVTTGDIIKNPLPEGLKLTFICWLKKRTFENFTKLNLGKEKTKHYYFNNLVNNLSSDSLPHLVADLTNQEVTDADLSTFVSNVFSFTHNSNAATLISKLEFIDTGETFQQELNNNKNTFNFSYDLKKTPAGRAKFSVEGINQQVYVANTAEFAGSFGVIEIFYKNSLPPAYQFQKGDLSIETKFYKIKFVNRATKWRYRITRKYNRSITNVKVEKTGGTPIQFSPLLLSPLASPLNSSASGEFVWQSNQALPLHEVPITGIKLSDQASKVLIPNLPNPSVEQVKKEGPDTISDVLITI
jgi:hypothetical protein